MLPTFSDIQPVAVGCDRSSAKSSAGRFVPVAVVVPVAAVVVVSAGWVFIACPGSCEPSSAVLLADDLREALGAAMAAILGGGARLASLGAVEDDAVADEFGVGFALADVSILSPSSACAGSTPSDARYTASFILSSAFFNRSDPATRKISSKRNRQLAM